MKQTSIRVVVVDDSEDNAEMLGALLEEHGCRVRTAHDGPRALELLDEELPDLVVLDLGPPHMDGFEAATEMRRRFRDALRIVALTGFSTKEYRDRAERMGIDAYVTKPVLPTQLEELLRPRSSARAESGP